MSKGRNVIKKVGNHWSIFNFNILALHYFESHEWSAALHLCLLRSLGHAATFAVNAALVVSQWQDRALTVSLHLPLTSGSSKGVLGGPWPLQIFGWPPSFLLNFTFKFV